LVSKGFLEVETPVLNSKAGGANARPFSTVHNELKQEMHLRVAPELFLKQLIVGGFEKVFEIGKNFRNEGIDTTHNPEFTSCELYSAYEDYNTMMDLTEEIICNIIMHIKGSLTLTLTDHQGHTKQIDFTRPWKRISMIEHLEQTLSTPFPQNLNTDQANKFFIELCKENNIECPHPQTTNRLINKLSEHFIESSITNPTFIIDQPQIMCPLAKSHRDKPYLTERFELFVDQKELVNSYTELNDPFEQYELFVDQVRNKQKGDLEANEVDHEYVLALEYGLPPTAGWGIGVDRLCMLLTDSSNIQEVILFPAMKPKQVVE
jgi:lysyl-tRNA synthetase class 2